MTQQMKKNLYEGMFIISATLSDDARKKALERIQSTLEEKGAKVKKTFDWGRRKLAYEIKGKKEGYYAIMYFEAPSTTVNESWKEFHLNEDLIRFMTLTATHIPEEISFKPLVEQA